MRKLLTSLAFAGTCATAVFGSVAPGCTLGGLADYEVRNCTAPSAQANARSPVHHPLVEHRTRKAGLAALWGHALHRPHRRRLRLAGELLMNVAVAIALLVGVSMLVGSCTFGSLADYDVRECNPRPSAQATDDCDRLNAGSSAGCRPFQCEAGSRRCVQMVRDDDKDGDPSAACGGGDCDDANPNLSSLSVGAPAPIASLALSVDEPQFALPTDGGDSPLVVFASPDSSGECLSVAKADVASSVPLGACVLLASKSSLLPTQPDARRVGDAGFATSFVSLSACAVGALGFAYADQIALAPCGLGAAKPAISMIDSNRALLAWYDAPAASRAAALDDCAKISAAPLRIGFVSSVAGPTLSPAALALSPTTKSMQPPATVTRDGVRSWPRRRMRR